MIAELDADYLRTRPSKIVPRLVGHFLFQGRFATTKYRVLNRLILPYLSMTTRLPYDRPVTKPILIIGTGRSGSTILGKVLSMHRAIGFLNEPKALWFTVDPEDDLHGHFGTAARKYRFSASDATAEHKQRLQRLYRAFLALGRSQRVLDKNPDMIFRVPFVLALMPDTRFLFLSRNGLDTIASINAWSNMNRREKDQLEDWWGVDRRKWRLLVEHILPDEPLLRHLRHEISLASEETLRAAVEWIVAMQEGMRLLDQFPRNVLHVPYEALVHDPRLSLAAIAAFCDLPPDPVFLEYGERTFRAAPARTPPAVPDFIKPAFDRTNHEIELLTRAFPT